MKERFATIDSCIKLLSVSQGLTGKMAGIPAITTSSLCNPNCKKNAQIKGSVCERCYTKKYLQSRPCVQDCYQQNSILLSTSLIPTNQLPFINATICRLESFGDIINSTQIENYARLARKNSHCKFALFTKNYILVENFFKTHQQPKNLAIIVSSLMLNKPIKTNYFAHLNNLKVFTVYEKEFADTNNIVITCGKRRCIDCKLCYLKNKTPIYISELLK